MVYGQGVTCSTQSGDDGINGLLVYEGERDDGHCHKRKQNLLSCQGSDNNPQIIFFFDVEDIL